MPYAALKNFRADGQDFVAGEIVPDSISGMRLLRERGFVDIFTDETAAAQKADRGRRLIKSTLTQDLKKDKNPDSGNDGKDIAGKSKVSKSVAESLKVKQQLGHSTLKVHDNSKRLKELRPPKERDAVAERSKLGKLKIPSLGSTLQPHAKRPSLSNPPKSSEKESVSVDVFDDVLSGNVKSVCDHIAGIQLADEVNVLKAAETAGKNRKGVIRAAEARIAELEG